MSEQETTELDPGTTSCLSNMNRTAGRIDAKMLLDAEEVRQDPKRLLHARTELAAMRLVNQKAYDRII